AGVAKSESTLLVLFLPSVSRFLEPIDQAMWETAALELLGAKLGGAMAFPKGRGVWRDDERGGTLVFDATVVIHCYTNLDAIEAHETEIQQFLIRLGTETNQGAVGFVINGTYLEIRFPLPS